ncbi:MULTISPECIES: ribonuclease H-like domain-containing protein [unclassified Bradyrhizobium]|uniref:ribonuclease H-like domain-containing protein n=1 Tax=unclassified Bradyrhizobium TaxID=2631580 RepID=UPI002916D613|nr:MULTISPECIES: ribonuclease H-like domain-containing protein [unclassified Bradyrhizobium]
MLFLDVETTGLSWFYDQITIVGWTLDGEYKVLVKGEDPAPLLRDLSSATALVTFNGTLFDLRFLRKTFGQLALPNIHLDLRYLARRAGLVGGQKSIERELKVDFRSGLSDLDGAAAVLLWHDYLRGNDASLSKLIQYNRSDVLGMAAILDTVLNRLEQQQDLWLRPPVFGDMARAILSQPIPSFERNIASLASSFRTFESTFAGTVAAGATIVGIDLTGSAKRGSGWCLLSGADAETLTVFEDEDMVARVLAIGPDLVSIDSPLSMPYGRTVVTDDDPGRQQFGIMRECERELKRRGVNVYPALLPSMQALTRRGMALADRIRAYGIPVIESYPGAAQDIMSIPRKGAGIEYLKRGLVEFGIKGVFATENVSHDELDAITAALVGSFFLAGKYEALRGPTEGALIVPDLCTRDQDTLVIGISGRICAGKTTAARMLEQRGFSYTRFSLVIDEEIRNAGGPLDRETRQRVGEEIHRERGQKWLCERVLELVPGAKMIVIDGLRFPEDKAFFVEQFSSRFVHLHIEASPEIRSERYDAAKEGRVSFAEADQQPVESFIDRLAELADITIRNEDSLDELERSLQVVTSEYLKGSRCLSRSS